MSRNLAAPPQPKAKAQRNFTDPDSRIMRSADKSFIQSYNAQIAVDVDSQIIVACDLTNQAADIVHLIVIDLIDQVLAPNAGKLPEQLLADAGYYSKENVKALE